MRSVYLLILSKLLEAHKVLIAFPKSDFLLPAALTILSLKVDPEST